MTPDIFEAKAQWLIVHSDEVCEKIQQAFAAAQVTIDVRFEAGAFKFYSEDVFMGGWSIPYLIEHGIVTDDEPLPFEFPVDNPDGPA